MDIGASNQRTLGPRNVSLVLQDHPNHHDPRICWRVGNKPLCMIVEKKSVMRSYYTVWRRNPSRLFFFASRSGSYFNDVEDEQLRGFLKCGRKLLDWTVFCCISPEKVCDRV